MTAWKHRWRAAIGIVVAAAVLAGSTPAFADAGIEGALLMARDAFQPNKDKSNDR